MLIIAHVSLVIFVLIEKARLAVTDTAHVNKIIFYFVLFCKRYNIAVGVYLFNTHVCLFDQ